jgi:mono/diheme cytochrome c family protein
MSGSSPGRGVGWLVRAVPLVLGVLSGCEASDRYPVSLRYPPRSDPLVVTAPPDVKPFYPDKPGELDKEIKRIGIPEEKGGLGGSALDPNKVPAALRNQLEGIMKDVFGTPAKPAVVVKDDPDLEDIVDRLKLDKKTLANGSKNYRRHCLHCHGLPGDGRGPTGPWLNPHPRDYRQGWFKFISTAGVSSDRKPRREDLLRTLKRGIDGTSMPSFGLESDEVLESLVSYVIHLSLRGEIEFNTLKALLDKDNKVEDIKGGSLESHILDARKGLLAAFLRKWAAADKSSEPPPYPSYTEQQLQASVRRGFKQFSTSGTAASCIDCHADFGRQVPFRYDYWGTLVRPANLTAGVYRGGRRPIDLYWRIKNGIPPSQMPNAALTGTDGNDPYWDLVNFVQALPYRQMLPEDVRNQVYPPPGSEAKPAPQQHARAD